MRWRSRSKVDLRVVPQMTPMIDVVFQLLTFFLVSFRIVQQEGDLMVKLPALGQQEQPRLPPTDLPPLPVYLTADAAGDLAAIRFQNATVTSLDELQARLEALQAQCPDCQLAVDLKCDPALRYEHTMAALTAVSGKRHQDRIVPLVADVRLTRP